MRSRNRIQIVYHSFHVSVDVSQLYTVRSTYCRPGNDQRGVLVILVPCYRFLCCRTFGPILQRVWWPRANPVTIEEVYHDKRLRHLQRMWSNPGKTYEHSFDCLRRAQKSLREMSAVVGTSLGNRVGSRISRLSRTEADGNELHGLLRFDIRGHDTKILDCGTTNKSFHTSAVVVGEMN
ncbi:hypothetical protein BDU57DRAFT_301438 [Ampelomyces quisqualis]|uniref:Uncharacterized protein n=1 Tax=Ampelomyces quisqualis TaxID=50730 RepID=A0A6A5QH52_AMPQU|nr:hypothetical protein BDU57DRAFT_301438 [Ampelomyces quisqualis]